MIKGKDIVVISIQPWDIEIGSNCKNIALEFAKNNRVLYVNPPLDRVTLNRDKRSEKIQKRIKVKNGQSPDLVIIEENLWNLYPKTMIESINWIGPHSVFKMLNKRNARLFANNIKSAISRLGFKNIILFNDSSMFLGLHLKRLLQPNIYAYYMRDNLVEVPYWKRHGEKIEPELIKKADVILNNSTMLTEYCARYNSNSFMVGQGCDVSLFNDEHDSIITSEEFESIPKPVIGYVGSLTTLRLDIELLAFIAKKRKDWSVVLVGPEDDDFKRSELHQLPNVYFLGSKESSSLPAYVKGFEVAMNPQVVNHITIGNYPRKIDEYLAMGKPVIATQTKAMEMFRQYVYLGKTKEDYVTLIKKALTENSKSKAKERIEFAKIHTWENNVRRIYEAIKTSTINKISWN